MSYAGNSPCTPRMYSKHTPISCPPPCKDEPALTCKSFTVPSGAALGTYYLRKLGFYDVAGNYRYYIAPDSTGTGNYLTDGSTVSGISVKTMSVP